MAVLIDPVPSTAAPVETHRMPSSARVERSAAVLRDADLRAATFALPSKIVVPAPDGTRLTKNVEAEIVVWACTLVAAAHSRTSGQGAGRLEWGGQDLPG